MGRLFGFIFVVLGSFIAGILLAPKSGKETRHDLMEKANEYKGKASAGMKEVRNGATIVKDELADSAQSMKEIAHDAAGGMKRTAGRVKEEATYRAKVIGDEVKQTTRDAKQAAAQQ